MSRSTKLASLVALLIMILSVTSVAESSAWRDYDQENSDRRMKVTIDVPYTLFGAYLPTAEFKLSDRISATVAIGLVNPKWTIRNDVNQLPGIFGKLGVGARFYLTGNAMKGFFLQEEISADYGRSHTGEGGFFPVGAGGFNYEANMYSVINKFYIGYSWVAPFGLVLESHAQAVLLVNFGWPNPPFVGNMLHFELGVRAGWAF